MEALKTMTNMKYARIKYNGVPRFCEVEDGNYYLLDGSYFENGKRTGEIASQPKLLVPVEEAFTKIVAIGKNYAAHAKEMGLTLPDEPCMFLKPNTALLPDGGEIIYPSNSRQVDYEAELAIIIGKTAKHLKPDNCMDYVFGYTCANDVTARDLQAKDDQWVRAKGFDTFLPLGPHIVKLDDVSKLQVQSYLNGELKQNGNTKDFIFPVSELLCAVTAVMTLYPGDVILTGTPEGIGPMQSGDTVTVRIEGIGDLENTIVK